MRKLLKISPKFDKFLKSKKNNIGNEMCIDYILNKQIMLVIEIIWN